MTAALMAVAAVASVVGLVTGAALAIRDVLFARKVKHLLSRARQLPPRVDEDCDADKLEAAVDLLDEMSAIPHRFIRRTPQLLEIWFQEYRIRDAAEHAEVPALGRIPLVLYASFLREGTANRASTPSPGDTAEDTIRSAQTGVPSSWVSSAGEIWSEFSPLYYTPLEEKP